MVTKKKTALRVYIKKNTNFFKLIKHFFIQVGNFKKIFILQEDIIIKMN